MPGQSRTLCWCPNRRRAMRQRVSNPDCAVDARPHSRREQYRLSAPPSVIGGDSPLLARSLASSFSAIPGLTVIRLNQMFRQFFVSLNGSASGRSNGEPKFRAREGGADRGERCAASRAFNGSSPTANLVSIIKEQELRREAVLAEVRPLVARASLVSE